MKHSGSDSALEHLKFQSHSLSDPPASRHSSLHPAAGQGMLHAALCALLLAGARLQLMQSHKQHWLASTRAASALEAICCSTAECILSSTCLGSDMCTARSRDSTELATAAGGAEVSQEYLARVSGSGRDTRSLPPGAVQRPTHSRSR